MIVEFEPDVTNRRTEAREFRTKNAAMAYGRKLAWEWRCNIKVWLPGASTPIICSEPTEEDMA